MSNLNNLIEEIVQEAKKEANQIIEKIKIENLNFSENENKKIEKTCKEIQQKAEIEAIAEKERIISNANLKARDMVLLAKQEIVSEILNRVLEKLKNLEESEYLNFVESVLGKINKTEKTEIILSNTMKEKLGEEILGYKVSSQTVDSGCSIKTGEIIYNNEFTTLLDFYREDLEKEILEKIFD